MLAKALEKNTTLTSIRAFRSKIGPEGAKAIAAALEKNNTLSSIDLSQNTIGPEGAKAIAAALEKNNTLSSIHLDWNAIPYEGAIVIAKALKENTTLTSIDLSTNFIGPRGDKAIAAALVSNIFILLEDSGVRDGACKRFIDQVHKRNCAIREILKRQAYCANPDLIDEQTLQTREQDLKSLQLYLDKISSCRSQKYLAVLLDADNSDQSEEKATSFLRKLDHLLQYNLQNLPWLFQNHLFLWK